MNGVVALTVPHDVVRLDQPLGAERLAVAHQQVHRARDGRAVAAVEHGLFVVGQLHRHALSAMAGTLPPMSAAMACTHRHQRAAPTSRRRRSSVNAKAGPPQLNAITSPRAPISGDRHRVDLAVEFAGRHAVADARAHRPAPAARPGSQRRPVAAARQAQRVEQLRTRCRLARRPGRRGRAPSWRIGTREPTSRRAASIVERERQASTSTISRPSRTAR